MNKIILENFCMRYGPYSTQGMQARGGAKKERNMVHSAADANYSGKDQTLGPLNFSIESGERVGVLGASGAGKSSLLRAIAYDNLAMQDIYYTGSMHKPLQVILSVMQESKFILNPLRTVYASFRVLYRSKKSRLTSPLQNAQIRQYLALMELQNIDAILRAKPHQLSGGMAQRVMFALVLALEPDWVLADELSASLDAVHEEKIMKVLFREVASVIMVTHTMSLVEKYCQRVLFLEKGRLIYDGSVQGLYHSRHATIIGYLDNVFLSHESQTTSQSPSPKKSQQENQKAHQQTSHQETQLTRTPNRELMAEDFLVLYNSYYRGKTASLVSSLAKHNTRQHEDRILRLENISFSWGENTANNTCSSKMVNNKAARHKQANMLLQDISLSLCRGETASILGDTGSGKSTLAQLLVGRLRAHSGNIYLNNSLLPKDMSKESLYKRASIQLMPQIPSLSFNPQLSIYSNLEDAFELYSHRLQELGQDPLDPYKNQYNTPSTRELFNAHIQSLCEFLYLDSALLHRLPRKVSGGQLQRCALIRMLLVFPTVLVLDEPVSHLDVSIRRTTLSLISKIQQHTSIGILLISHLPEVHGYFRHTGNRKNYRLSKGALIPEKAEPEKNQ